MSEIVRQSPEILTSVWMITAIQKELAAAGIVGERSKKPLPLSSIGSLLRNWLRLECV